MKASEVIQRLQDLMKEHGDLDVIYDQNCNVGPIELLDNPEFKEGPAFEINAGLFPE